MKAIIVCVDYWDYLSLTLPLNKRHFDQILIVTSPEDERTQQLCNLHNVDCYTTDSFYDGPSAFNKYKALEEGIDRLNLQPTDWLCIMDADVIWPRKVTLNLLPGNLYTPFRRMMPDNEIRFDIFNCPPEAEWLRDPRHRIIEDFSGYSQIFRVDDPHLGSKPWHETNWIHAGGGDTMFQNKWPKQNKIRPGFDVLHLGTPATNWFGRATNFLTGERPENQDKNLNDLKSAMKRRRMNARARLPEYGHEKY